MTDSKTTVATLREKSAQELASMLLSLSGQLREARFNVGSGQLKKVHQIAALRKSMAKIQTIQQEQKNDPNGTK